MVIITQILSNITLFILSKMLIQNNRIIRILDNSRICKKPIKRSKVMTIIMSAKEMIIKMKRMNKKIMKNKMMKHKMKVEKKSLTAILKEETKNSKTMIILIQRRIIIKMEIHNSLIKIMRKKGKI